MIQVRRTIYRGQPGWKIVGYRPGQTGGWPVSIFTLTEPSARHIARKIRDNGGDITTADFNHTESTNQ